MWKLTAVVSKKVLTKQKNKRQIIMMIALRMPDPEIVVSREGPLF